MYNEMIDEALTRGVNAYPVDPLHDPIPATRRRPRRAEVCVKMDERASPHNARGLTSTIGHGSNISGIRHPEMEEPEPGGAAMSIQVSCPNGHVLRVKDSFAGKSGRCPHCRAKVHVPLPHGFSEDDVISALGPPPPPPTAEPEASEDEAHVHQAHRHTHRQDDEESGIALFGSSIHQRAKVCSSCCKRTSFAFSICPSCGTPLPATCEAVPAAAAGRGVPGRPGASPPRSQYKEDPSEGADFLPKKTCVKCNRDVDARTHICPHCHIYLGGPSSS